MRFLKKNRENKGLVGLAAADQGFAVARACSRRGEYHLRDCGLLEAGPGARAQVLGEAVARLGLKDARCNLVLDPADYNLLLVDAPKVQPEELAAALRWRIKDLIDWPLEEAALDVFPIPADAYRSQGPMVYVVVMRRARIVELRDLILQSGLSLQSIDIPELALRNLSNAYADDSNGLAFIDLKASGSMLNLCRNGLVYLTRHLNTPLDAGIMASAQWDTVKERLVLEIQRSLDYYESQMGQDQISRLLIAPRGGDTLAMAGELDRAMGVKVETMDLLTRFHADTPLPLDMQQHCLLAIGGALRAERREAA